MQITYLNPLFVFLASTLLLYFIPSLFIREFAIDVYNIEYPGYVIDLYVKNNLVSFIAILLAIISYGLVGAKIFLLPLGKKTIAEDFPYLAFNRFVFITSWLAILFSVPYLLLYAFPKMLAFGSDIDGHAFRLLGFDDARRSISALFEIARRVLFPIIITTGLIFSSLVKNKTTFVFALFIFFLVSFSTFDRGPVFLFLLVLFFGRFLNGAKMKHIWFKLPLFILILVIIGAVITTLQYNSSDLSLFTIFYEGLTLLYSRIIFDPAFMSLEYNFNRHYDLQPLFLEHARIGVLIGRDYVGSANINSNFVTPVGFVSDIWRNFGIVGVFIISYLISVMFIFFSYQSRRLKSFYLPAFSIIMIVLSASIIYGVLFSLGTFFLIFVAFFLIFLSHISLARK
jgi:hypothetical protein